MPLWLFWEGWKDKSPRGVIVDGNAMGISHGALNVEVCVGMMVACMPHARQLVRDTMLQHGQSRLATSSSAEGIFIDRSLRAI